MVVDVGEEDSVVARPSNVHFRPLRRLASPLRQFTRRRDTLDEGVGTEARRHSFTRLNASWLCTDHIDML